MTSKNEGGRTARLAWAAVTPIALACVFALSIYTYAGILLVPVLSMYLDGRSRTWTAAATVLVGCVALSLLFGLAEASAFAFIGITTVAAYVLARKKMPFKTGLAGSAVGGVLGAVAMLGILSASLGKPVGAAASNWLQNMMKDSLYYNDSLNFLAAQAKMNSTLRITDISTAFLLQSFGPSGLSWMMPVIPQDIVVMSLAQRAEFVKPFFEQVISQTIPGIALTLGLLVGGLGYYVPQLALHVHRRRGSQTVAEGVDVPPFASFKLPRYIVISIFLLQFLTSLFDTDGVLPTISVASTYLFEALLTVQALALFSFLLNRKRVVWGLQVLILGATLVLFFWILYWVGFLDALFDVRAVMSKVDLLRTRGRQGPVPGGPAENKKTDRSRREGKNSGDGEDGKQ